MQELATQLRERRGKRGLREVAQEIGEVSASTLSRIEQGKLPDLDTFVRICRWLGVSMETFIIGKQNDSQEGNKSVGIDELSNQQTITVHLRADRTLDPKTAKALAKLIQLAYEAIERDEIEEDSE
ncbi:MAG: helix-turn-helix transcriptional regulator [Chloroflexota bacterium]